MTRDDVLKSHTLLSMQQSSYWRSGYGLFTGCRPVGLSSGRICVKMIIVMWIIHVGDLKLLVISMLQIRRYVTTGSLVWENETERAAWCSGAELVRMLQSGKAVFHIMQVGNKSLAFTLLSFIFSEPNLGPLRGQNKFLWYDRYSDQP